MNPKKINDIIKKTANDLDLPESTVDSVTSFYWLQVRNAINNVEVSSLSINSLGTFNVKPWILNKLIKKNESYVANFTSDNIKKMTFQKYTILDQAKKRLEIFERLKEDIALEKERKQEVLKKRKEYVSNKNLEGKE